MEAQISKIEHFHKHRTKVHHVNKNKHTIGNNITVQVGFKVGRTNVQAHKKKPPMRQLAATKVNTKTTQLKGLGQHSSQCKFKHRQLMNTNVISGMSA